MLVSRPTARQPGLGTVIRDNLTRRRRAKSLPKCHKTLGAFNFGKKTVSVSGLIAQAFPSLLTVWCVMPTVPSPANCKPSSTLSITITLPYGAR